MIYNLLLIRPEKINKNFLDCFDFFVFEEIFRFKIIDHIEISLKILKILVRNFSNFILKENKNILKEFVNIFFFLKKIDQIIILEIFIEILKKIESEFFYLVLNVINNFLDFTQNFRKKHIFMIFLKQTYYFIKKLKQQNYNLKESTLENTFNIFIKNILLNLKNLKYGFFSYLDLLSEKSIFNDFTENEKRKIILKTLEIFFRMESMSKNIKNNAIFKIIKIINNFELFSNNFIGFLKNNISEQNYFFNFLKIKNDKLKNLVQKKNKVIEENIELDLNLKRYKKKLKNYLINFFIDIFINPNEEIKNMKLMKTLKFEFIMFLIKNYNIKKKNRKIFLIFNLLSFYIKIESEDIKEIYNTTFFFISKKKKFLKNYQINKNSEIKKKKKKFFFNLKKNINENYINNFKGNWSVILDLYNSLNSENEKKNLFDNLKNLLSLKLLFELRKIEKMRTKKYYLLQINYKKTTINFNKENTFAFLLSKLKKINKNKKKYILINKKYYFEKEDKIISLFFKSESSSDIFIIKNLKFTNKINKDFFICLEKIGIYNFIDDFYFNIFKNILIKFYKKDIYKNLSLSSKNVLFEILKRKLNFKERFVLFKNLEKSKLKEKKNEKNLFINREENLDVIFSKIIYFEKFNNVKIQFENEEGFGIGVLKEFFFILSEKLKNYKYFEILNNEFRIKYLYLNELKKIKNIFFYLGVIFGRVFNQNLIFNFFLTKLFWNFVFNRVI